MVKLYRFHGNGHTSRQATERVPHFRPHLCRADRCPSDAVAVHLRAAVSCTRFASFHKSRIMVLAFGWRFSAARASRGRNRLTNWVISPLKLCGVDLVKGLRDFYPTDFLPDTPFLWPGTHLSGEDLWQLSEPSPSLVDRKPSGPTFLDSFRLPGCTVQAWTVVCLSHSGDLQASSQIPAYKCLEGQAIGSWVEFASGAAGAASRAVKQDLM